MRAIKPKKIGVIDFMGQKVTLVEKKGGRSGIVLYGQFEAEINTITIYTATPPALRRQVVVHELFHAFLHYGGFSHMIEECVGSWVEETMTLAFEHAFGDRVIFTGPVEKWLATSFRPK